MSEPTVKTPKRGTGYIVIASIFGLLAVLILWLSISSYFCESENVKECLADDLRPDVLWTGIVCGLLILLTSGLAIWAKIKPAIRPTLNIFLIISSLFSASAFLYFLVVFVAAGIASTT